MQNLILTFPEAEAILGESFRLDPLAEKHLKAVDEEIRQWTGRSIWTTDSVTEYPKGLGSKRLWLAEWPVRGNITVYDCEDDVVDSFSYYPNTNKRGRVSLVTNGLYWSIHPIRVEYHQVGYEQIPANVKSAAIIILREKTRTTSDPKGLAGVVRKRLRQEEVQYQANYNSLNGASIPQSAADILAYYLRDD